MIHRLEKVSDYLERFVFTEYPIRGERVLIEHSWQELLLRRNYPTNVKKQLGELFVTAILLSATIKIEGKLTVQVQGEGPLNLMVVQVNAVEGNYKGVRAVARFNEEAIKDKTGLKDLCGEGYMVITIDSPTFKEPYQGIIPLIDESIKEAIERYFKTSEQLDTTLFLAGGEEADERVSGMLLQRLPGESIDEDAFNRLNLLSQTVTKEELLTLSTKELLERLFREETIRIFEPDRFYFECTCSKERTLAMIYQLSQAEVETILIEEGSLYVDCEFCGKRYLFEASDLDFTLFKEEAPLLKI